MRIETSYRDNCQMSLQPHGNSLPLVDFLINKLFSILFINSFRFDIFHGQHVLLILFCSHVYIGTSEIHTTMCE